MDADGQLVTDDFYKSELLNKYFASVGVTDNGIKPSVLEKNAGDKLNSVILLKPVCLEP